MAREILRVLVHRLDYISDEKGLPAVERMQTYQDGKDMGAFQHIQVRPLGVDHSAPDSYMFYIQAGERRSFLLETFGSMALLEKTGGSGIR